MLQFCLKSLAGIALVLTMLSNAHALPVYSELVTGDLSNSGLTPTVITLALGSNEIVGTTGQPTTGVFDRDYFTITVPSNLKLAFVIEEAGTEAARKSPWPPTPRLQPGCSAGLTMCRRPQISIFFLPWELRQTGRPGSSHLWGQGPIHFGSRIPRWALSTTASIWFLSQSLRPAR